MHILVPVCFNASTEIDPKDLDPEDLVPWPYLSDSEVVRLTPWLWITIKWVASRSIPSTCNARMVSTVIKMCRSEIPSKQTTQLYTGLS